MRTKPSTGTRAAPGHAHGPKAPTLRPQARAGAVHPVRPHSPRSRVRRCVARSGPARKWPRSLCTQTPVTVAFAPRGGLQTGPSLGAPFGFQESASSPQALLHPTRPRGSGTASPPSGRSSGTPDAGRAERGARRGRQGALWAVALSRGPCARSQPPSEPGEQAASAESARSDGVGAGTMGGERGAGRAGPGLAGRR